MRVIAKRTLRDFWERHPQAKGPLEAWHQELIHTDWAHPSAIKAQFRSASLLPGNRVVFNVGGNKYRLVVKMNYQFRIVYIRFIGTHQEYDQIDVNTV
ncbi:MAG: type II toxin-antitoxin system HigB family toxin [Nitrospirales bacterium]